MNKKNTREKERAREKENERERMGEREDREREKEVGESYKKEGNKLSKDIENIINENQIRE